LKEEAGRVLKRLRSKFLSFRFQKKKVAGALMDSEGKKAGGEKI